ncbi:glycosyltransferase family 1 protein [Candidatus Parcubacteria bacterium]|jgi:glycosyltransferase involved in cell wall biosynthesis|nr:MAG: glycosyltransferase family 1 protein [Candidatus Parcubacteria bacterium]
MRMMITLVGGIPEPSGGVTNYLFRLAVHFRTHIEQIIDLYPSANKWTLKGIPCRVRPVSKLTSVFWLVRIFLTLRSQIVYFNFSMPGNLFVLALLPKLKESLWYLTLHHGELGRALEKKGTLVTILFKFVVRRFDRVGYINEKQKMFYYNHGVSKSCLYPVMTYLPYIPSEENDKQDDHLFHDELKAIRGRYTKIVVASGYPTSIYRHDWVLEQFEHGEFNEEICLILCLYGADNEGLLAEYQQRVSKLANVFLYEYLSPKQFQTVLANADIYVRPTETDSFGVAIAEALHVGLAVLASDACERPDGTYVFNRFDQRKFAQLLHGAIEGTLPPCKRFVDCSKEIVGDFLGVNE